jgi:hypothetical protein
MKTNRTLDICIDFDGTCVTHFFPFIGKDIGAIPVLKKLIANGHNLILFTMRSDTFLTEAVQYLKEHGVVLYGINKNPTQSEWTNSPKAYGQIYIDDAALGCPLRIDTRLSDRPFVDWVEMEKLLEERNIIR